MILKRILEKYIRPIVFGLEDGLVSTMGVVTGIAAGSQNKFMILLSGTIIIFVESLSMASGEYLSSKSEKELHESDKKDKKHHANPKINSMFMGLSYMIGGGIPIVPYIFLNLPSGIYFSVIATMIALFLVGFWKSRFIKRDGWKGGFEMLVIAGASALVGFAIGYLGRIYFGVPV